MLLRPDYKSVEWTMNVLSTFLKTKNLRFGFFFTTLATGKACLELLKPHWFVGLESYSTSFQDVVPILVDVHAKQV